MNDFERGQWRSLDRVLAYIQSHEEDVICRKKLYRDIMELRPLLDTPLSDDYIEPKENQ
jgi:hypothetical protein